MDHMFDRLQRRASSLQSSLDKFLPMSLRTRQLRNHHLAKSSSLPTVTDGQPSQGSPLPRSESSSLSERLRPKLLRWVEFGAQSIQVTEKCPVSYMVLHVHVHGTFQVFLVQKWVLRFWLNKVTVGIDFIYKHSLYCLEEQSLHLCHEYFL